MEVLAASGLTRARLLRLAAILRQAQEQDMPVNVAAEQVVAEAPSLRPLVDQLAPKLRKAFIVFLLFLIETLIQQGISELRDDSATREDVRQAIEQALDQVQRTNPAPSATPSRGAGGPRGRTSVSIPRSIPAKPDAGTGQRQAKPKRSRSKRPPKQYGQQKKRKRNR